MRSLLSNKKVLFFLFLMLGAGILLFWYRSNIKMKVNRLVSRYRTSRKTDLTCEGCREVFTDYPAMHERAYYNGAGIIPQEEDRGITDLYRKGVLVSIQSCNDYIVRKLHHSKPYILPDGQQFLKHLSERYRQNCIDSGLIYIPFEISSVTRSRESVEKLKKTNPNAIENSPHLKGKTIDISYDSFGSWPLQRKAFIQALKTMRENGDCYVKHELNGCLHITVR